MERELLRKLGEETIFSAKGHFKAVDLRRQLVTYTIWGCAILNVIGLIGIDSRIDRWLSALGLIGTIGLLIWNEGEGKDYKTKHKQVGETYLSLHKEIRACYFLHDCTSEQVEELSQKVIAFDKTAKPDIPGLARWLAKRAIEVNKETDNWFAIHEQ